MVENVHTHGKMFRENCAQTEKKGEDEVKE